MLSVARSRYYRSRADGDSIEIVLSRYPSSEIPRYPSPEKNVLPLTFRRFILRLRSDGRPVADYLKFPIAASVNGRNNKGEKNLNRIYTVDHQNTRTDWIISDKFQTKTIRQSLMNSKIIIISLMISDVGLMYVHY